MKKFIRDYLKIIAMSFTGVVFILSSFYLIINYYHSEEIKKTVYISENDINYNNYKDKLTKISNNLLSYRETNKYQNIYNYLSNCYNALQSDGTYSRIKLNSYYTAYDIYQIGANFQTNVYNICWASNLSRLTDEKSFDEFSYLIPIISNHINTINSQVSDSLSEIENNSSYYYTTNVTSATVRNSLGSDYKRIINSYNEFADIVLYLTDVVNNKGR